MNVRYSGLDAARAFFLIIGVALHSIQPFAHDYVWRVTHVSAIDNAWLLIEFVRDFRMYGFL